MESARDKFRKRKGQFEESDKKKSKYNNNNNQLQVCATAVATTTSKAGDVSTTICANNNSHTIVKDRVQYYGCGIIGSKGVWSNQELLERACKNESTYMEFKQENTPKNIDRMVTAAWIENNVSEHGAYSE